jgi:hypothetical protein
MADRYYTGATNGLWSVQLNWSGNTFPTTGDIVYASGKTIIINQNITVGTITTGPGPLASSGGTFSVSGGSYTLNTNISAGTTSCLTISGLTTGQTLTINGNIVGGTIALAYGISKSSGGTLNVIGNISGGTNTSAYGLFNAFTQPINITGDSYVTSGGSIVNNANTTITMRGNVYNYGSYHNLYNAATGTINLIGNIYFNPQVLGAYALNNATTGVINMTGNSYNTNIYNTASSYCIYQAGSPPGAINVVGDVYAGANITSSFGALNNGTGTISITGNVYSYGAGQVLYNNSTGVINLTSPNGIVQSTPVGIALIYNAGSTPATINIIGNISGSSSSSPSRGYVVQNTSSGIINITGNTVVRDVSIAAATGLIHNTGGSAIINIFGNVSGGSVANSIAISFNGSGILNISGNVYGGSSPNTSPAIYSNNASARINITGSCVAGSAYPAVYTVATGIIHTLTGSLVYTNGISPFLITSNRLQITPTSISPLQSVIMTDTNNNNRYFLTTNTGNTIPLSGNVRSNIIYSGFSPSTIQYTGSCIVPPYSSVTLNVSTDNGYGIASGMTINNLSTMISSYFL